MEHCFTSLKNEWVTVTGYISFSDAAYAIPEYFVRYYSELRPHEYDGRLPLNCAQNKYWKSLKVWLVFVNLFGSRLKFLANRALVFNGPYLF